MSKVLCSIPLTRPHAVRLLRPSVARVRTVVQAHARPKVRARPMNLHSPLRSLERLSHELKETKRVLGKLEKVVKGPLEVNTMLRRVYSPGQRPRFKENLGEVYAYSSAKKGYVKIPNIWLRDNCQCSTCVHPETRQRLLDTWQIPKDIKITSVEMNANKSIWNITWTDGHRSSFSDEFLALSVVEHPGTVGQARVSLQLWGSDIEGTEPIVNYLEVMQSETGVRKWLRQIRKYGFCYVDHTPPTPKATEKLLERIAFIRLTHYGGFYDFTADLASKDTAYTNLALDAHTDNTYFSDPAGLQALHLLSHTEGTGGKSLLVDGFKIASQLQLEDPEAYEVLASVPILAHASGNDGISISPYRGFPVLNHDPTTGFLDQVRWNSNDRAAIQMPTDEVENWYDAASKWVEIVRRPENEYWSQLVPGRVLVFDNWRVMHGRSEFTGKRRICGGYINRDDWISRLKMLHFGQEEVMDALPFGG